MPDKDKHLQERKKWAQIVAKTWSDPEFKKKLLANPNKVLNENGIHFPDGVTVKIHENSDTTVHFVLPPSSIHELTEEELRKDSAGNTFTGSWCGWTTNTIV